MSATSARLVDAGPHLVAELDLPACEWNLPVPVADTGDDLVAVGADLQPSTLVTAYSRSLFPMPVTRRRLGWFSPRERGVIPLDGLRISRSLRRAHRRFEIRWNRRFTEVIEACADPDRPYGWISTRVIEAYGELHRAGLAHSVEVHGEDGELVGGLYGVALGGLFAGESMFHRATDASKVALVALVEALDGAGFTLLDVQWATPHLSSLGAVGIDRADYLERLEVALRHRPLRADLPGRHT